MRRILLAFLPAGVLACSGGGGGDGGGTQPSSATPTISLSSASTTFSATAGAASPAPQSLTVSNSGTGTLGSLGTGTITYGAGQTTGWLVANVSSATAPAIVTLTPTVGTLTAGTYTATVPITSGAAGVTNSPQAVSVTFLVNVAGAASVTLTAAGQSTAFLTSPNLNTTLAVQPGSQYLVAVVNTDASNTIFEGFSLSAKFAASAAASQAVTAPRPAAAAVPATTYDLAGPPPPSLATQRALAQNHTAILDENRQIFARFGNPSAAWSAARASAGRVEPASAAISQTIGNVNKVYVRKALGGTCTSVDSIGARTVAIGQHVIVLADTNRTTWPQALRPDSSFYQTFASEYDQLTFPHVLTYIGNPLAYDTHLSSTGKITVTITPLLNNFAGGVGGGSIVAFVSACDFFPFAASGINADFSNQTEMFYSWVPGSGGFTVTAWEALLRATAAHETKHIVSYTDRILNEGASFVGEEIWLEEGLAQVSSEIWERNFNQATWLGHASFAQTVGCELSLSVNPSCDAQNNKPYALLGSHLPFFFEYLQAESTSNSEGLGLDTPANYGAGWTIARWAIDQYAGSAGEAALIKSLINEPSLTGLANLSQHTGQTVPLILVYWNLATAVFQTPSYVAADVRATIPSFNFANIFSIGQSGFTCNGSPCGLFTTSGSATPVYPIQPIAIAATGNFSRAVSSVPGTSASFFLLTGSAAGVETLQLLNATGGTLPSASGFRVAILRVQ